MVGRPSCRAFAAALAIILAAGCGNLPRIRGPEQADTGPGGADYKHAAVYAQRFGIGVDEFWIFSPDDPRPAEAPCVVFLHGWGAMHPRSYGAWIQHLVRKGNIVIYPRYQNQDRYRTPGDVMLEGARGAVKAAWARLNESGPVAPVQESMVWFGHSFGGVLATRLAASSASNGLPPPGAVLSIEPGAEDLVGLDGITDLPVSTIVKLVVGDADTVAGEKGVQAIIAALGNDGAERPVEMIRLQSDRRSAPALVANHVAPLGATPDFPPSFIEGGETQLPGGLLANQIRRFRTERYAVDALDYYCFWKIGDALIDTVFQERNFEFGFGDTPEQRFMGILSDGTPVAPLVIESIK